MKDRRIDRMLKSRGRDAADVAIYYSPINYFFLFLLLIFLGLLPLSAGIIRFWQYLWMPVLIFLLASYVNSAALSNSFALTTDELIVVNPNFPFRQFETFKLNHIRGVKIAQSKRLFSIVPFVPGVQYVEIDGKKYYCAHLDRSNFDEKNLTIDDLHAALKAKNIPVDFKLT
jgi:hypothetical protein